MKEAVLPGSSLIWPEAKNNIAFEFQRGEAGPVEAAIRGAAHVVECKLVNNRVVAEFLAARWVARHGYPNWPYSANPYTSPVGNPESADQLRDRQVMDFLGDHVWWNS